MNGEYILLFDLWKKVNPTEYGRINEVFYFACRLKYLFIIVTQL